jgi:hypothetical protein
VSEEQEDQEKGFVVIDRRGGPDREEEDRDSSAEHSEAARAETNTAETAFRDPLPSMDFSTLLHSFAISALHHLGIAPGPDGATRTEPDLALAQQNIDILEVLRTKTEGNLSGEEQQLLEGILYEVRMRFVEVSGRRGH